MGINLNTLELSAEEIDNMDLLPPINTRKPEPGTVVFRPKGNVTVFSVQE